MKQTNRIGLFTSAGFYSQLIITLVFNAIVALVIWLIATDTNYLLSILQSQIIGLSIFTLFNLTYEVQFRLYKVRQLSLRWTMLALILGATVGVSILLVVSAISTNNGLIETFQENLAEVAQVMFTAMIFGAIIIYFFISRERLLLAESELQKHQIAVLDSEKQMLENHLKILQSQIEPHFLFNTLSNIIGLIDKNPARSKLMLESLTQYLRKTLEYTRKESASLEDELNMIAAYLAIFKERMGDRLQYEINVCQRLYTMSFPPMLLQPIVENAIKHGLEPKLDGGYVNITGDIGKHNIKFIIEDSGKGLNKQVGNGVGIANVSQRLRAIFGEGAALVLEDNKPTGLRVIIEVPRERM